jgi:uncharacterized spore protein YtfJ
MPKLDIDQIGAEAKGGSEIRELITKLAQELGRNGRAEAVFGEPVERDGVTVIPVAKASWGLGAGRGAKHGLGAGLKVTPTGYIEIAGGRTRFRRVLVSWAFVTVALGIGTLAYLLLEGRR